MTREQALTRMRESTAARREQNEWEEMKRKAEWVARRLHPPKEEDYGWYGYGYSYRSRSEGFRYDGGVIYLSKWWERK